jgi:hypothetical protein
MNFESIIIATVLLIIGFLIGWYACYVYHKDKLDSGGDD